MKSLTAGMNNIDRLASVQYSAGRAWTWTHNRLAAVGRDRVDRIPHTPSYVGSIG